MHRRCPVQLIAPALMDRADSGSVRSNDCTRSSQKTMPQPYVVPAGRRSTTLIRCPGSNCLAAMAKYSPAGPPPTQVMFTGDPLSCGGGVTGRRRRALLATCLHPHQDAVQLAAAQLRVPRCVECHAEGRRSDELDRLRIAERLAAERQLRLVRSRPGLAPASPGVQTVQRLFGQSAEV